METQERVINISELEELEKIVKDAQARIAELKAPTQLVTACTVKPLGLPFFSNHDSRENAHLDKRHYDREAWSHFLELGKMIHKINPDNSWRVVLITETHFTQIYAVPAEEKVRKISDLTGTRSKNICRNAR